MGHCGRRRRCPTWLHRSTCCAAVAEHGGMVQRGAGRETWATLESDPMSRCMPQLVLVPHADLPTVLHSRPKKVQVDAVFEHGLLGRLIEGPQPLREGGRARGGPFGSEETHRSVRSCRRRHKGFPPVRKPSPWRRCRCTQCAGHHFHQFDAWRFVFAFAVSPINTGLEDFAFHRFSLIVLSLSKPFQRRKEKNRRKKERSVHP